MAFYHQEPNLTLMASSCFFILPALYAYSLKHTRTAFAFSVLTLSSVTYHATKHATLYYIDQACVMTIVALSFLDGVRGGPACLSCAVAGNLGSWILYTVGRHTQSLIWSPDYTVATRSHAAMHLLVGSLYLLLLQKYPPLK